MKKALPLLMMLLAASPALAAVDPFYQGLLRDGQQAFDRKDYGAAARQLRLACFGMLEDPKPLADCLARLLLAQDGANDVEGFRETFRRLTEVEDRFKGYSQGEIAPELRAALEAKLAARIPAATLAAAPAFRPAPAKKPGAPAPAGPAVKPAPASPIAALPQSPDPAPAGPPGPAKTASTPPPAAGKPLTEAERKKLDQARQLLAAQRPSKELRQAFELARAVADAHPDSKEAQHLAAEGAYRISRWSDANAYFRRGGDPGDGEPERLFYMAVSLYESGDPSGAAAALKRSLPNLKRTPYVETYIRKILGQ
ncbi:MAG: tetratricopeptide repeat protein [Thermoanaerobaculia bacterium]